LNQVNHLKNRCCQQLNERSIRFSCKNKFVQDDINQELNEYNSTSQATHLELGKVYCHRAKTYEHVQHGRCYI
jgi:hypothetical protein